MESNAMMRWLPFSTVALGSLAKSAASAAVGRATRSSGSEVGLAAIKQRQPPGRASCRRIPSADCAHGASTLTPLAQELALVSHEGRAQASNQRVQRECCYRGMRLSAEEILRAAQEALDSLPLG